MLGVYDVLVSILNFRNMCPFQQLHWFNYGLFRHAALLPLFLLNILSVRILDMIVCSETLCWLFSPAGTPLNWPWKLASFVLLLSLTQVVVPSLMLVHLKSIPTQNTCVFTKASLSLYGIVIAPRFSSPIWNKQAKHWKQGLWSDCLLNLFPQSISKFYGPKPTSVLPLGIYSDVANFLATFCNQKETKILVPYLLGNQKKNNKCSQILCMFFSDGFPPASVPPPSDDLPKDLIVTSISAEVPLFLPGMEMVDHGQIN